MTAFDAAAREIADLVERITALETEMDKLRVRLAAPARTAYRVSEVAEMCGVHPNTVRSWIASGRLAAEDMGGWYAIPAEAAEAATSAPHLGRAS